MKWNLSSKYDIFLWLITDGNGVLLTAFRDKIPIFHFGKTAYRTVHWARGDGSLCAQQHMLLLASESYDNTHWTQETEYNRLNSEDFPCSSLTFAPSVPRVHLKFPMVRVTTCSCSCMRPHRRGTQCNIVRAQSQVPQHFDCAQLEGNRSLIEQ